MVKNDKWFYGIIIIAILFIAGVFSVFFINYILLPKISITTNKKNYKMGEDIIIKIKNNSGSSIAAIDHKAFCSIIALEQLQSLINKELMKIQDCPYLDTPITVIIGPHSEKIVEIPNDFATLATSGAQLTVVPNGVWRAKLVFWVDSLNPPPTDEKYSTVYSNEFTVK